MDKDAAGELISVPSRNFTRNVIELFELVHVILGLREQLNRMTMKTIQTFDIMPVHVRRSFIPDSAYTPFADLVKTGINVADVTIRYVPVLLELTFCRSVDYFLIYVAELLALVFKTKPEALKSGEQITVEFVLEHTTIEDLLGSITERRVLELSFKGIFALNDYLKKRLGFELFENQDDLQRAIRIVEDRNLFVHNRGVVNRVYLSRVPWSTVPLGEKLTLTTDSENADVTFLSGAVADIDRRSEAKFGIPRIEKVPESELEFIKDKMPG